MQTVGSGVESTVEGLLVSYYSFIQLVTSVNMQHYIYKS